VRADWEGDAKKEFMFGFCDIRRKATGKNNEKGRAEHLNAAELTSTAQGLFLDPRAGSQLQAKQKA